ncbi:hypothetical protein BDZ89DRAFT_1056981 [Hymenopellis radicata]|nr:hypothetical protein BDZ89DRAFT_1056981 [Hymenopellis radicata]
MSGHGGARDKKDKSILSFFQHTTTAVDAPTAKKKDKEKGKEKGKEKEKTLSLPAAEASVALDEPRRVRFGSDFHNPGLSIPPSMSAPTTSTAPPQQSAADDFDMEFGFEEFSEADWEEASTVHAASTQRQDAFTTTSSNFTNDNLPSLPTSVPVLSTTNPSPSLTSAQLEALQHEYRHVREMDKSCNSRPSVIEDSLFDDDDGDGDGDGAEEALESESDEDQPNSGVLQNYLETELQRIQDEIQKHKMPKNYVDGTFWRRPPDPLFAFDSTLGKGKVPDAAPFYLIDIFLWIPYSLPGAPDVFRCECGGHLSKNGYNDNPIARRVRTLHKPYFLLTSRLRCDKRRKNDAGCGRSYQGTDAWILAQLPRHLQQEFPAYLSARGGVDKSTLAVMRTLFATRFGPRPCSELLCEMQHLRHANLELSYLSAYAFFQDKYNLPPPEPFSDFDDRLRFGGTNTSVKYCKAVFTEWMRAHLELLDRVMASLPGTRLAGDHTFKIIKFLARLLGQSTHVALYSSINEFEECRAQALTLTKRLNFLESYYEELRKGLEAHGHPPTSLMYTDNAVAELSFHETATPSLKDNVKHVVLDPFSHLRPFVLPETCRTHYYDARDLIDNACCALLASLDSSDSKLVLGFDVEVETETAGQGGPGMVPQPRNGHIDVIQIALESRVYVLKVTQLHASVPANLRALFLSTRIMFAGQNVCADLLRIAEAWSFSKLRERLQKAPESCCLELGQLAKLKGVAKDISIGLPSLVGSVLRRNLKMDDIVRLSRWSADQLSEKQKTYAALNAYASLQLWQILSAKQSVGQPLESTIGGEYVHLSSGRTHVAEARVSATQGPITLSHGDDESHQSSTDESDHVLKLNKSRVVLHVEKILVPGFIVPLHSATLAELEHQHSLPFDIMVHRRSVHTRAPIPAQTVDQSKPSSPDTLIPFTPADLSNAEIDLITVSGFGRQDAEDELSKDEAEDEAEEIDRDSRERSCTVETSSSDEQPTKQDTPTTLLTRLFDDIFHVEDRLIRLLPKKHSAFEEFGRQFSKALWTLDRSDVGAVREIYEKKNMSLSYAFRAHPDKLRKRIRHAVPPPDVLVPHLRQLFDSWADVECSVDGHLRKFFSDTARDQGDSIIRVAQLGLISDPPDVQMYFLQGKDKDGLNVYRTIRGTSGIEGGLHTAIRRTFGSLQASTELTDALLRNIRHRRNTSIGYFNRTGKKYRGHYDTWLSDEIVELAAALDIAPSFPIPDMLATRIETAESFGIIPIPKSLAQLYGMRITDRAPVTGTPLYHGVPVYRLSHLVTTPISPFTYLSERQKTEHPVLPVSSHAEFKYFTTALESNEFWTNSSTRKTRGDTGSVNFEKFARFWNDEVHKRPASTNKHERLFYKLPEQLERHYKVWARYRAEKATLASNSQRLQPVALFTNEDARLADLPPARLLPKADSTIKHRNTDNKRKRTEAEHAFHAGPSSATLGSHSESASALAISRLGTTSDLDDRRQPSQRRRIELRRLELTDNNTRPMPPRPIGQMYFPAWDGLPAPQSGLATSGPSARAIPSNPGPAASEVSSAVLALTMNCAAAVPAAITFPAGGMAQEPSSNLSVVRERAGRSCVSCSKAQCVLAKECKGRGGHQHCPCHHPKPKKSRSK